MQITTLPHKERQTSVTFRNAAKLSGPEVIWDGLTQRGKVCCGLTLSTFQIVFFIGGLLSAQSSKPSCDYLRLCLRPWYGKLHIYEGTINAERYIQVLEPCKLLSRQCLFQVLLCVFWEDNAKPTFCNLEQCGFLLHHINSLNSISFSLMHFECICKLIKDSFQPVSHLPEPPFTLSSCSN